MWVTIGAKRVNPHIVMEVTHLQSFMYSYVYLCRSGMEGSDPTFSLLCNENPASRTSVVAIPNNVFFLKRAVKSRIPSTFPKSRVLFWSNPGSGKYSSRPCISWNMQPVIGQYCINGYSGG